MIIMNFKMNGGNRLNIDIGTKVKEIRKAKKISIKELAEMTELSTGLISQIERNQTTPSIVSLWKLAKGLGISIGYLFDEEKQAPHVPVVKKADRKKIITGDHHAIYELLSPDSNRKIEFLMITLEPSVYSAEGLVTHEGEECGVVLQGSMTVITDHGDYDLEAGDSIYFESTIPHRYINTGNETCVSVWAMTPPKF